MIAGFRFQIELLAPSVAPDEAGGAAISHAPAATIWAAVEHLSAIGAVIGDRGRRIRRIKALVRSRADLGIGARIRYESVDYEIVSIEQDDERGRRVFLIGEEVVQ